MRFSSSLEEPQTQPHQVQRTEMVAVAAVAAVPVADVVAAVEVVEVVPAAKAADVVVAVVAMSQVRLLIRPPLPAFNFHKLYVIFRNTCWITVIQQVFYPFLKIPTYETKLL